VKHFIGVGSPSRLLYLILMEIMMADSSSTNNNNVTNTNNNGTNQNNLIWLDMEMSGLLPDSDRILELAAVVTDAELNVLGESPVFVVHQSDAVLDGMDAWNKGAHGRSGLIEKVKASTLSEEEASAQMIAFLKQFIPAGKSPMCGNSICQDRRFMARYMPELESYFHYRNLDVSVFKELARRWKPEIYSGFKKASKHEALADIYESIDELKYYREHFIVK
jgi:oligoribonuclease